MKKDNSYKTRVKDVYDKTIRPLYIDDLIIKAKSILKSKGINSLPIIDYEEKIFGCIDRKTILTYSYSETSFVSDIAHKPSLIAELDDLFEETVYKMMEKNLQEIPVVDGQNGKIYKGCLSEENILEELIKNNNPILNKNISEFIITDDICCSVHDSICKAWKILTKKSINGLFIINDRKKIVGILTFYDLLVSKIPLLSSILNREDSKIGVNAIMNKNVIYVKKNIVVIEAARLLLKYRISRLPIVDDDEKYIGYIDRKNLIRILLPFYK